MKQTIPFNPISIHKIPQEEGHGQSTMVKEQEGPYAGVPYRQEYGGTNTVPKFKDLNHALGLTLSTDLGLVLVRLINPLNLYELIFPFTEFKLTKIKMPKSIKSPKNVR